MKKKVRHKGRIGQTGIYLAKFARMFFYQSDWKVLPMAAIITCLVVFVVGQNLFVTQEGTTTGAFALVCVCIWIGFFNSIQVVCREREIVKREHRSGLHITSYIAAQMIFQMVICLLQTGIVLLICRSRFSGVQIPRNGLVTPYGITDMAITIFLTTYAADMMALMISCIVHNSTTAMTVMPFMLIFQLIFSGGFFELHGMAQSMTALTVSHWGLISLCAVGRFNAQPMVTLWNTLFKFRNIEYMGEKPLLELIKKTEREGKVQDFLLWSGSYNQKSEYVSSQANVLHTWQALLILTAVFVIIAIIMLEFIDRDKR